MTTVNPFDVMYDADSKPTQQPARVDAGPGLAQEPMPSLADVAQEVGGAWPAGWYRAKVIAGYNARGYDWVTGDTLSKGGDSRNLRVAMTLTAPRDMNDKEGNSVKAGATRNEFWSTNYRITDLTAANAARVKANPKGDPRLAIALGKLGQLEVAFGQGWAKHPEGHLLTMPLIGREVDVRRGMNKKTGYMEINAFAPVGSKTKSLG